MTDSFELKKHYSETATSALLAKWTKDEQLEWAEVVLREELLRRGVSESRLSELRTARATTEINPSRAKGPYLPFPKLVEYALTGCWLLIQGSLGVLAAASIGDMIFYGSQYSLHSAAYYSNYQQVTVIFVLVALIPRFALSYLPFLAIPYLALVVAAIVTASWCIDNNHLSLAKGNSSLLQACLYALYFLAADASFILLKRLGSLFRIKSTREGGGH